MTLYYMHRRQYLINNGTLWELCLIKYDLDIKVFVCLIYFFFIFGFSAKLTCCYWAMEKLTEINLNYAYSSWKGSDFVYNLCYCFYNTSFKCKCVHKPYPPFFSIHILIHMMISLEILHNHRFVKYIFAMQNANIRRH